MRPTGLFFGRIRDYKGVDVLLDALPHIRKCIPDFRLIVAGSGADRRLRERITNEPEVDFYDRFIEDAEVPGLFGSADVVILPYREASWSGVASLAANYGIPIVGGAVGGLSEQLAHGGLGQRVPPDRADLLAEAVVATFRDVSRTEHQPSAGIGRTVSWASAAEVTVQTYQELLGIAA
jgi:glycosyltransferase involved in cell wall biosynthesis